MKTIVAATDFSQVSLNAVEYAADMACMTDATLVLFHVCSIPIPISELPVAPYSVEELEKEAQAEIDQLKEELLNRTRDRIIIHSEVRSGDVISELTEYCARIKPHTVVIGAESAHGLERAMLGGKTLSALKRLQFPLLVVPPFIKFNNIRKIGLACDLREVAESVRVQEIKELVDEFKAELHVLHVIEESRDTFRPEIIEQSGFLQEMLRKMKPVYHFINEPVIEKGIINFAEENKLDLLIIIPKYHSLVNRILKYSHSKQLVLHAHIPVMSLHE